MYVAEIKITLQVDGCPTPEAMMALGALANVMEVQAEDGLYTFGSPEALVPGEENEHLAALRITTPATVQIVH